MARRSCTWAAIAAQPCPSAGLRLIIEESSRARLPMIPSEGRHRLRLERLAAGGEDRPPAGLGASDVSTATGRCLRSGHAVPGGPRCRLVRYRRSDLRRNLAPPCLQTRQMAPVAEDGDPTPVVRHGRDNGCARTCVTSERYGTMLSRIKGCEGALDLRKRARVILKVEGEACSQR